MSFLKKPLRKIRELGISKDNGSSDSVPASTSSTPLDGASTPVNGNGASTPDRRQSKEVIEADRKRRSVDKARIKAENKKRQSLARIEDEKFIKEGPPELTKLYKPYSMNMSKRWDQEKRLLFKELDFKSQFSLPRRNLLQLLIALQNWMERSLHSGLVYTPCAE